jgi:peptidoglycan biosynthesis protein MviN/MurJ (putative lipid II flippase)
VGRANGDAGIFAALLLIGGACGLSTGTGLAYLRAVGRVSLEARFGLIILCTNALLTIVLAITIGPYGVVAGTLGAYAFGAAYFFRRLGREINVVPVRSLGETLRIVGAAITCASVSFLWGIAMATLLPKGVALVPLAAGTVVACLAYGRIVLGLRVRPAQLRTWLQS